VVILALVVGTDTYISRTDCDTYLTANYPSANAKLTVWNALSDADCEVYLRQALKEIDNQPLQGYKYITTQALAFPRVLYTEVLQINGVRSNNWYEQPTVPQDVKDAQCEIALELAQGTTTEANQRAELQRQGVRSFTLGKLSESYSGASGGIVSYKARQLLSKFMNGGFSI